MNELFNLAGRHNTVFHNTKTGEDAMENHAKESIRFAIDELERMKADYMEGDKELWDLYVCKIDARINELKKLIE